MNLNKPIYLDCNATTPLDPAVLEQLLRWYTEEIGNPGSRTHEFGTKAKSAVQRSRNQLANVLQAQPEEVVFTSGATESNNIAILGLANEGRSKNRRHVVSTAIEHKAVLEPLELLASEGFEVTLVNPESSGVVSSEAVNSAIRDDTLLVSVMHVNNETGVCQPIEEIASYLADHEAYFHVDAAQGFGKDIEGLLSPRIDLISVSSHKIFGPSGVGALVSRRRGYCKPPLTPISYGGGQERGLRPGTLPTPLIVAFGTAAETALEDFAARKSRCKRIRKAALTELEPLGIRIHGDPERTLPHVVNFSVDGIDSEALMLALKDLVAISNGSACTSNSYQASHVLQAMGIGAPEVAGAVRMSWCHLTPDIDFQAVANRIRTLL